VTWLPSPETIAAWRGARGPRRFALSAAAFLFRQAVTARVHAYRQGWVPRFQAPLPILSVGNLEVGGTGKTAIVRFLAEHLPGRPAIVTRGYGNRLRRHPHFVQPLDPTSLVGDEPRLLKRWLPRAIIAVSPARHRVLPRLIDAADWVILDDGFQHLALERDLDIVVVPPVPGVQLLPRGMLREPREALQRATIVWQHHGDGTVPGPPQERSHLRRPTVLSRYRIRSVRPYEAWRTRSHATDPEPDPRHGCPALHVVTATGRPERVGGLLRAEGCTVTGETWIADHHPIGLEHLNAIARRAARAGAGGIVVTEKDAVRFDEHPLQHLVPMPLFVVEVSVEIVHGADLLRHHLQTAMSRRLERDR